LVLTEPYALELREKILCQSQSGASGSVGCSGATPDVSELMKLQRFFRAKSYFDRKTSLAEKAATEKAEKLTNFDPTVAAFVPLVDTFPSHLKENGVYYQFNSMKKKHIAAIKEAKETAADGDGVGANDSIPPNPSTLVPWRQMSKARLKQYANPVPRSVSVSAASMMYQNNLARQQAIALLDRETKRREKDYLDYNRRHRNADYLKAVILHREFFVKFHKIKLSESARVSKAVKLVLDSRIHKEKK